MMQMDIGVWADMGVFEEGICTVFVEKSL